MNIAKASSFAGGYLSQLTELADTYNPLNAAGDPNGRCYLMLKEATELTIKVKTAEKEWKEFSDEAKGALDASRAALEHPLPTLYQTSLPAGTVPTPNTELLGGPGYRGDDIDAAKVQLASQLQAQAYNPMDQWVLKLKDAAAKQKVLNKLFADVEAKRKAVEAQKMEIEKLQARVTNGDHKAAGNMPQEQKELADKEAALQAATQAHDAEEAGQFERLKAMISEAPALRGHIAAALEQTAAAMNAAKATITAPTSGGAPTNGGAIGTMAA